MRQLFLPALLAALPLVLATLPAQAADPEFLGAVLDFLLMEDATVIAFCDAMGLRYDSPMQARAALPGGPGPHWT